MHLTKRTAIASLIVSTLIFTLALVAFCVALGLDLTNEGWADDAPALETIWYSPSMLASLSGFLISIVMFFVGLHRVSRPG